MNILDMPTPTVLDLFSKCGGLSLNIQMAGLDRDCCGIVGARPGVRRSESFSDFSNIIRMIP